MARVRVLLATRTDYIPTRGSLQTSSGLAASTHVPCPDCRGSGRQPQRRRQPCLVCAGTGRRRRRVSETGWDFYAGTAVGAEEVEETEVRAMTPAELDRAIDRLDQLLAEYDGAISPDRMERALAARDRSGSYERLERAMAGLDVRLQRVLSLVYDHGLIEPPNAYETLAVRELALAIGGPISIPDWAVTEEAERTRADVVALADRGLRVSEIAERVGIHHRSVDKILHHARRAA